MCDSLSSSPPFFHCSLFIFLLIIYLCLLFIYYLFICQPRWPRGLRRRSMAARLLGLRIRIPPGAGCLSVVCVVCCQVEISATRWSLVQRSPTDCGVCVTECNLQTSTMRTRPTGVVELRKINRLFIPAFFIIMWFVSLFTCLIFITIYLFTYEFIIYLFFMFIMYLRVFTCLLFVYCFYVCLLLISLRLISRACHLLTLQRQMVCQ
jgi:hypothetical protein